LVKELVSDGSKSTIRGKSYFQGEFVFTQYYPILSHGKGAKKAAGGYESTLHNSYVVPKYSN